MLTPTSVEALAEAVRVTPRLLALGAGTKRRLSAVEAVKVSTARLNGIIEYDPGEFTFTALAGTPVREIIATLAAKGQYPPFDPMLAEAGSTLGGTVASGLSGPGRFRFGGLRDFILGVRFVDGRGQLLRLGGKVVKNAAGFDVPKFLVGSLGRFGVLAEITFKVFPKRAETITLKLPVKDADEAARILMEAANTRWEPDALDWLPGGDAIGLRLAGPAEALANISKEILAHWPGELLTAAAAQELWSDLHEFGWAHPGGVLIKVAATPDKLPALHQGLRTSADVRMHASSGGNVAFISLPDASGILALAKILVELGLAAVTLRGDAPLWLGRQTRHKIGTAVKAALDPDNRFPSLDD